MNDFFRGQGTLCGFLVLVLRGFPFIVFDIVAVTFWPIYSSYIVVLFLLSNSFGVDLTSLLYLHTATIPTSSTD
jgi:hypothetical protein